MIETKSVFYYGFTVTANNFAIDFDDGLGETEADIKLSNYTFTTLADAIALALNNAGTQVYTVTTDRDNRFYTISAPSNFDLLVTTGQRAGVSIWSTIGFTSDKTGSNTYTSDVAAGFEYLPQFRLQNFTPTENFRKKVEAKVNQSATGIVEVITFGQVNYTQFEITNITEYPQNNRGGIDNDPNAVTNARNFLEAITDKQIVEFMRDRDNRNLNVESLLIEKTPESGVGVDFRLKEIRKRQGWFETGLLLFRKV